MSNKAKGSARERQYIRRLREDGWVAMRAPASLGPADILALRAGERPLAIQVKANMGSAFKNFQPAERHELQLLALQAGARAVLVHWPPGWSGAEGVQPGLVAF